MPASAHKPIESSLKHTGSTEKAHCLDFTMPLYNGPSISSILCAVLVLSFYISKWKVLGDEQKDGASFLF